MTRVLLHNFLMKSSSSQNIYNPQGTIDKYDNGVFIEGLGGMKYLKTALLDP